VHEAVALGLAGGVSGHLAGQDGAKLAEGVVQRLVVNGLVQVLHKARKAQQRCWVRVPML
jgi:hypothetical protein